MQVGHLRLLLWLYLLFLSLKIGGVHLYELDLLDVEYVAEALSKSCRNRVLSTLILPLLMDCSLSGAHLVL